MLNITQIFRSHLDLTMKTGDGLTVRIVERPKLTMSAPDLKKLVEDLRAIARDSLPLGELNYGVFDATGERLEHSVITLVTNKAGVPIAFNALALMDIEFQGRRESMIHLGLVMVDPKQRSRGLSWILYGLTCVVLFLRNQMRPLWISNVTQVPAIVGMVADTFVNVFPVPDKSVKRTFSHLSVAREIMSYHRHVFGVGQDAEFDFERFIIRNAYTGGSDNLKKTFSEATKHRTEPFNKMCETELDYNRGDDFLQIGEINSRVVAQFLVKDVPKNAIFQVIGWFFLAMLNAVLLPVIQWFCVGRRLGHLRPLHKLSSEKSQEE